MTVTSTGWKRTVAGALYVVMASILGTSAARAQGRASVSPCGAPFKPTARLPGVTTTVPNTSIRLTLPRGWTGQPAVKPDGTPYYQVWAPAAGSGGQVALAATNGAGDRPLPQLLLETAQGMAQPQLATFGAPRLFALGRDCGGQLLFRAPGVEGYVALVRNGEWLYGLVAKYPATTSTAMRAGLDTIVASVHLAPLPSPVAARVDAPGTNANPPSVVGCWERAPDAHTMHRIQLRPDGTYNWFSAITGLPYNVEPTEEEGRYHMAGNTIFLTTNQGQTETYALSTGNGILTMGSARYAACN